jgi:outer membrane lipoprotein-sorting protein
MKKLLVLFAILTVIAAPVYAQKIASAEDLITAMRRKYDGKWYKTLTFVQKNTQYKPDGTTENSVWYEALSAPGKLRVDFDPLAKGDGMIFADGTQHSFKDGKLANSRPLNHQLLILGFDVYLQPVEKTLAQLKALKFDLSAFREDVWQGKPVYVVGAKAGDEKSPQFWIDRKNLVFVRALQAAGKERDKISETQFNKYEKVKGGGWVAVEVLFMLDGKPTFKEEYSDVQTNVALNDNLFDPQNWMTADRTYYKKK